MFTLRRPCFILTHDATLLTSLAREFQACVNALTVITGSDEGKALVVFDHDRARNAACPSGRMDSEAPIKGSLRDADF